MRTTVDIQEDVLKRAKQIAAEKGRKLGEVVSDALREAFYRREQQANGQNGQGTESEPLPVDGVGGVAPGVDLNDNAATRDLMDESDGYDLDKMR